MQTLKAQIVKLEATEAPKDYTVEQIKAWLEAIKTSPDEAAVRMLIEKIEVKNKTEFNITSTLNRSLENMSNPTKIDTMNGVNK